MIMLLGALASCNALDLKPVDQYSLNNYWNTEEQAYRFVHGLHFRFRSRAYTMLKMGEFRSGCFIQESISSTGEGVYDVEITTNNLSAANPGITGWGDFYMDIYQINHAIEKITAECSFLSDKTRNTWLGQLYGMRAYYYFHLLRTWGGVPLRDKPDILHTSDLEKLNKARATEQETFDFVKADALKSCEYYSSLEYENYEGDNCYWNKAASKCLLAEVLLWGAKVKAAGSQSFLSKDPAKDLETAMNALLEVEPLYSMNTKFTETFSPDNKSSNKEIVLAFRFVYGETTNHFNYFTYNTSIFTKYFDKEGNKMDNPLNIASGNQRYEYSQAFYDSFAEGDSRRDATFLQYYLKNNDGNLYPAGRCLRKFLGTVQNKKVQFDNDIPVYRYPDIALMLAEIANENEDKTTVSTYLAKVRNRNFSSAPAFSYTTKEEVEAIILKERSYEFVGEGKLWFDMRRMLSGKQALALVENNEDKLLWPIDAAVLSKDPLVKQNKGY